MFRRLAVFPLFALLAAATPPATRSCPLLGSTYVSQPAIESPTRRYRLLVAEMPGSINTLFRFQTIDGKTGRQISEIRMVYSCPNGRAFCSVAPASRPGPQGLLYSEVISLARDFRPATGDDAPHALILPGFNQADWLFTRDEMASPDLTLAPDAVDGPDLSDQIVWTLSGCGKK